MNQPAALEDAELQQVIAEILKLDPEGQKTASVLRATIDQLYDGQRTGRYRWDQLYKTEKTHCGTLVEINLHREFNFQNGTVLDYRIAGIEVDCKFSQSRHGWMIPPEARGHLCLVIWAEDSTNPRWSMGVVRTNPEHLTTGGNRDSKSTLNGLGRASIVWLFQEFPLAPNVLLQLEPEVIARIMSPQSGQQRVNELFRSVLNRRISRNVIATVAQENDYMKRVRANGGARSALRPEGIVILGQYRSHTSLAITLGIEVPARGESVAVRLSPADQPGPGVIELDNKLWRVARQEDPPVAAPELPRTRRGGAGS